MATVVSDTVLQIWKSLSFQEKDTWTLMFTVALFTIAEAWKQPNCKWIKWCSIYSRKKNAVTLVTDGTWTYSGAFFRVYKCQIIMILEEGLTDFMGFPPPHCTHPKKFRPASQRWQHAVFKAIILLCKCVWGGILSGMGLPYIMFVTLLYFSATQKQICTQLFFAALFIIAN